MWPFHAKAMDIHPYAVAGIGPSFMASTPQDGLWYQQAFPHRFDRASLSYRVGGGLRLTPQWSLESTYVHLGSPKVVSQFVWDHHYDPIQHRCLKHCDTPNILSGVDTVTGFDVSVIRRFPSENWTPYVRLGGAMLWHTMRVAAFTPQGDSVGVVMHGTMPSVVGGVGVCYTWICGEVLVYQAIGHSGNPLSTRYVVPSLSMQLELW